MSYMYIVSILYFGIEQGHTFLLLTFLRQMYCIVHVVIDILVWTNMFCHVGRLCEDLTGWNLYIHDVLQ